MQINAFGLVFGLLVIFQLKHFICDYPLQNSYMLQKFRPDWGFFWPLCAHCGVHAAATFLIVLVTLIYVPFNLNPSVVTFALMCVAIDFIVHFFMDRIKAGPKYLGRYKPLSPTEFKMMKTAGPCADEALRGNTYFWWALGFDQMVHHLTDYAIILMVLVEQGIVVL